jgi:predicted flap endonuclease-1-like 5' DNA nuclease
MDFSFIILAAGIFLMGLWLGWLLWNRYKQAADQLRVENDSQKLTINALRGEMDATKAKLAAMDSEKAGLLAQFENLSNQQAEARDKITFLEQDLNGVIARNRELETELGLAMSPGQPGVADIPLEITSEESSQSTDLEMLGVAEDTDEDEDESQQRYALDLAANFDAFAEQAEQESAQLEPLGGNADAIPLPHPDAVGRGALTAVEAPESDFDVDLDAFEIPLPARSAHFAPPEMTFEDTEPTALPVEPTAIVAPQAIAGVGEIPLPTFTHTEEDAPRTLVGDDFDDLKIVEGIGPKIEEVLRQHGLRSYSDLAGTSVGRLKEILATAGARFAMHDPGTWSAQALLAANGEWDNLKAYQDFLNAGKRPK